MNKDITTEEPRIIVTSHGPYRVIGDVTIFDEEGNLRTATGIWCLCRCGGSRNKPFCDVTHGLKNFDGSESADHGSISDRCESYPTKDITIYDDRSRCAHFGQCTANLPGVFRQDAEPFVDPDGASPSDIATVVSGCPSGALAYALGNNPEPVDQHELPSIKPIVDGPYRVRGKVQVIGTDGRFYELRERQTLCRCGHSRNKPFCDGSHWYAGFRDPLPPELVKRPRSVYDWAGGIEAFERLTTRFYDKILSEPDLILEPIFRGMDSNHAKHVAAWLAETFGGPATYTHKHGGYERMVAKHRGLGLNETQRQRWVSRMVETIDEVGLPSDPGFRSTFLAYIEWGTRIAVINSQHNADVIEHAPVPLWGWGETPPFDPQPWDDPTAAENGRLRYAEEQSAKEKKDNL